MSGAGPSRPSRERKRRRGPVQQQEEEPPVVQAPVIQAPVVQEQDQIVEEQDAPEGEVPVQEDQEEQQQQQPGRTIRYASDAVMPDLHEPVPSPLPEIRDSTLLDFQEGTEERRIMERLITRPLHTARTIDWALMGRMGVTDRLQELFTPRWRRLLDESRESFYELTIEFLSTFTLDSARLSSPAAVTFALGRQTHTMSIAQFAVHMGLYTEEETRQPVFTESLIGWSDKDLPRCVTLTQLVQFWPTIADGRYRSTIPASQIRDPILRLIHRALTCTVYSRYMSIEKVTHAELFCLYCIVQRQEPNLAMVLLFSLQREHGRGQGSRICMGSYITRLAESLGVFEFLPREYLHREDSGTHITRRDMMYMPEMMEPGSPPRFRPPRPIPEGSLAGASHQVPVRERARLPRARATQADRLASLEQSVDQLRQGQQEIRETQVAMAEAQQAQAQTISEIRGIVQIIMDRLPPHDQPAPP